MSIHPPLDDLHVTSPFGTRTDPISGKVGAYHPGVDFRCAVGTPVYAAAAGVVSRSYTSLDDPKGRWRAYGERIIIDHGDRKETSYAHLSKRLVFAGDQVVEGQLIGLSGNTGASTGPHLHFEYRLGGTPQDPMPLIRQA